MGLQDDILYGPTSYPLCKVPGHHPDSKPHIHDDSASTTFACVAAHAPASIASPDAPSSSVPVPLHVVKSLTDVPPLDNFHPAHQTTIEGLRIPVTSPDPATASAMGGTGITIPHPTPETSTPVSLSSTSPPAVALQHNADPPTPSDPTNLPSSASSNPAPDILPTGAPLSSHSTMTRSDLSPSFPESHRSIIVTTTSPGPTSTPDPCAAAKDYGSPKPGLRKEKDALDPPSVNRVTNANTIAALDLPSRSRSLPSVTDSDVAIVGLSLRTPNTERIGDYPSHSSHYPYDIV